MGYWVWEIQSDCVRWSENIEALRDRHPEILGRTFEESLAIVHPEDRDFVKENILQAVQNKSDYNIEFRVPWPDGNIHWINGRGQILKGEDQKAVRMLSLGVDISDRKQVEEQLRLAYEEMERRVQERTIELIRSNQTLQTEITERKRVEKEILEISQKEQRRFGSQLHDEVCQELMGIMLLAKVLTQKMEREGAPEAIELKGISELIDKSVTHAREMARGLYPVELEGTSLMRSLRALALRTQDLFMISCEFHCPKPIVIDDNNIATHLYRIAQEGVNNAIRHGKASQIQIGLLEDQGEVSLSVKDNGVGIIQSIQKPRGIGLNIMKYRARMIEGSLTLEANQPQGVILKCVLKTPFLERREVS